MQIYNLAIVPVEECQDVLRKVVDVLAIQRSNDCAVQGDITWVCGVGYVDLNIPRVHISMEKVVLKHLGKECFNAFMSQHLKIYIGGS